MAGADRSGPRLEELAQWEEVVHDEDKAIKTREEEILKGAKTLKTPDIQAEPTRASAAGSSSQPSQPLPPGPATHIHKLPDEVLEQIFALLNPHTIVNVLSVCQRWHDLINNHKLIKKLKFEYGTFRREEGLCLIYSAQGLKSLELNDCPDTVAFLDAVSTRCTNLLYLSVDYYNYCDSLIKPLRKVLHNNPHITELSVRYFNISEGLQFFQELGTALPYLRKLKCNPRLSVLQLHFLLDGCCRSEMEELTVSNAPWSEEAIAKLVLFWGCSLRVLELNASNLTDGALGQLAGCSELRHLRLVGLNTRGDSLYVLAALSQLETLRVTFSSEVRPDNWCRFFSQSRSSCILRKLSLRGWVVLNDRILTTVAAFCPQLEELEVYCRIVTISSVRKVLQCCHKLHNLSVNGTDTSVAHIVPELPQLAPQLRRICIGRHAKDALGEATLRHVQAQMPHLTLE